MTTQPDSSSPSPYDVFLSFRGEDTRTNFTDHLHSALVGKGIHTFIDDDELPRGEEIAPALLKAIEDSRISLIVFSENYASSRWCLDELVEILRCKESKQQIIWPIFYKVDPSHVRNQTSKFGDAFEGLIESKFKDDKEKVLKWRKALTEAANLSGWHFEEGAYESTFINNIVDGIFRKVLSRTSWHVATYPVGIQSRVQDVKKLLDVGGNGRRMVGIWGKSGIGKTTIAKAIWHAIAHKFGGSCFLENVREGSLVQLQKTLLQDILGGKKLEIASADKGISIIHKLLRHKKILLILDDVDQLEQLEKLAGDDWFGEGSRVIITTKNRRLLNNRKIELIYEVKKLYYNQALELFSWHAFERSEPPEDYLELAQRAIAFADGLPLALKILGSHLRGIDIRHWQVILDGYGGEPYTHIERILQKSYDALDHRAKEYFLDIACFFKGEYKDYVLKIVPKKIIEEFVDKALITIEWSKILMHDLLANLGKDIVHKESPNDPGQRSRLWFYEDVEQVLTESTGTRNIKGIMVKLPEPAEIILNPECFRNMVYLQVFINHNASLCGDINYLPNALRFIDWPSCQLQSLPPNFQGNRLVGFNMLCSHIRQLEGYKHLPNLTYMNLGGCQFLEKIPDLSGIPNIKYLGLSNCTSLVEVDDSVGFLDKLVVLHLDGCVNLTRFGTRLRLKSLEELDLRNCKRLESFPEIEVKIESLRSLDISESGVRELPPSIAFLTGLESLILRGCFNLTGLELRLFYCWSTLRKLDLSGYKFVTLPECIRKFVSLYELYLCDCTSLLEIPQEVLPPRVRSVFLDNCTSLEKIPKLPLSSDVEEKELRLINCARLRGYDITENIFLDQVSSQFTITLPGDEVPKWFSCCKDATLVKDEWFARCEVCFEIPPNLDWGTLRLVLCFVNKGNSDVNEGAVYTHVRINRKTVRTITMIPVESHVALYCIPLLTRLQQSNMCQIIFEFYLMPTPVKILCGVHLLGHQVADVTVDREQWQWLLPDAMAVDDDIHDDQHLDNELLSLPSASETSLGNRPQLSDVFLSFRGEDTRTNFTDHLHSALVGKGIHTFIDDDELPRGEEIAPALLKAIEESRISLIVFSENYASSRWCLDELVKILQCKQSKQQVVLPIFYKVDPSHVRNQTNSFGDAFKGLIESKFKDNEEKVLKWRRALTEAANLSGWHFKEGEYEATFINSIVDGILSQVLSRTYLNVAKYPVGIQSHVQDVEMLLDVGGNGRHMVGIWGTSGIGKTTIAKAIFNAVAYKFEGSCFLPNIREGSLIQLQETLLHEILGVKELKIASVDKGISIIHKLLRHKKILLILDDVNQLEQLDNLAGVGWFGEGSRVIITTQDSGLLKCHGIELIYEVQKLCDYQALELFSLNAFGINEPPKDYLELAQRAIAFADGLPLALTILGSHLRNRDKTFWQGILDGFKGEPYTHIERILQKSYDALDDYTKEAFLDIACFFKGEFKDYVLGIVPENYIEVLVDKAMITIEWDDRILMHDLLANLGKDIVHKESPNDPGKRSRLWFYEDVKQVLTESTGTRNIKGIMVNLPKAAKITLNPECFRNMVNLQIFINHNASLHGNINYLPNALRIIDWPSCQSQSLPPNFQGNRFVEFKMPGSHIRQLKGFKHLPNLTHMNLSGCQFLEKFPDLSGIPYIKDLNLSGCTSLVEVDDSIGLLDKLVKLDLSECVKLTRFGTRLRLKSLEELDLRKCKRLESFPEIEVEMESLWRLNMQESGIRELPLSISYLTGLQSLDLSGCFNLTGLELRLLYCWSTLRELYLSGINFVTLPECISKFVSLYELDLRDCKSLLEIPQEVLPPRVSKVFLDNCTSLEKIPKLPLSSVVEDRELSLTNCARLRGYDITENSILDQVSSDPHSEFKITLLGDEVPKWFSCCKEAITLPGDEYSSEVVARCEVCFEIPPNLDWETLRLVLCVVNKGNSYVGRGEVESCVRINRETVQSIYMNAQETHVSLNCIPLLNPSKLHVGEELTRLQQGNMCQIIFEFYDLPTPVKILCGVHLLGHQVVDVTVDRGQRQWLLPDAMAVDDDIHDDQHQDNELLSLPSASETSLGKRPRLSDFMALDDDHRANVVDVGDHEAQRGEADHPKRRHTDLNEEPKQ